MQDFRNLEVWKVAHALTLDTYVSTKLFPKDEQFGLTSQLRRAAVSIEANLAEGCGRGTDADFARFVQLATGSASEVYCHLMICMDLGYLAREDYQRLADRTQQVRRMLIALLKKLRASD